MEATFPLNDSIEVIITFVKNSNLRSIVLLSDTHGYLDETILKYCREADEIWHAGDFGTVDVSDRLSSIKPLLGVYGNVDGNEIRMIHPLHQRFACEGLNIWITHIGGYPGHYAPAIRSELIQNPPDIFITGHSHILKVMRDQKINNLLHINPGAAGIHGFHHIRTMIRFKIDKKKIFDVEAIELGLRGDVS